MASMTTANTGRSLWRRRGTREEGTAVLARINEVLSETWLFVSAGR